MIEFCSVSKRFPNGTVAVRDFSLVAPTHLITVLVGSSGSGKTTLLRMINRMVEPSSGAVKIDGADVADRDAVALRRSLGYVMQGSGLMPHFTVAENIATVPVISGARHAEARRRALGLMDTVGLARNLADRYPRQLSGGEQQRVGVARGLAADPDILLMDEPFGAVDPITRAELQDELLRLQQELGKTVLFVTHDIEGAFRLGDRIAVLESEAHIAQVGTAAEITSAPATDFVERFIARVRR